jgi:hypothetical protein
MQGKNPPRQTFFCGGSVSAFNQRDKSPIPRSWFFGGCERVAAAVPERADYWKSVKDLNRPFAAGIRPDANQNRFCPKSKTTL